MRDLYDLSFSKYSNLECFVYENERYTFGKVQQICSALATYLVQDVGVKHGDRVVVAQRDDIALARALLTRPRLLVLDGASSNPPPSQNAAPSPN